MAFYLSPLVDVNEIDLSTTIPAVATSIGVIVLRNTYKGPENKQVLVADESDLIRMFGEPTETSYEDLLSASGFLKYGNKLYCTRVMPDDAMFAGITIDDTGAGDGFVIAGKGLTVSFADGDADGVLTHDELTVVSGGTGYVVGQVYKVLGTSGDPDVTETYFKIKATGPGGVVLTTVTAGVLDGLDICLEDGTVVTSGGEGYTDGTLLLEPYSGFDLPTMTLADLPSGDPDDFGKDISVTTTGDLIWAIASSRGNWGERVKIAFCNKELQDALIYGTYLTDTAIQTAYNIPGGDLTGTPAEEFIKIDSRLETSKDFLVIVFSKDQRKNTYALKETFNVSTDPTAKDFNGDLRLAEAVINEQSQYTRVAMSADLLDVVFPPELANSWYEFSGAANGDTTVNMDDNIINGYRLYDNAEEIDVNLFIDSNKSETVKIDLIALCEERKDCMTILDCPSELVINNVGFEPTDLRDWRNGTGRFTADNLNQNTSYAAVYGNWIEVYDKYNQKYRWLPASGFVGGIYAKTDDVADPWWAPAGLNRAVLTGVRRLAWNPKLGYRDILYSNGINPIVSFSGQGKVIWGQKTMLSKESAFNRVNVRRLFLVLEKAISTAAKYFLFEPNDPATRSLLVNMIVPFLRDVQSRRGIYDFRVVCDESINTPERIDRNELWCNIFIKPTRTAEFIVLNFIATKTGASFEEAAQAVQ